MSKITETMSLIDFPKDAAEFFEEVLGKIEADAEALRVNPVEIIRTMRVMK